MIRNSKRKPFLKKYKRGGTKRKQDNSVNELSDAKNLVNTLNEEFEELMQKFLALPINQQNDPKEPLTYLIGDVANRLVKAENALKELEKHIEHSKKIKILHTMRGGLRSRKRSKRSKRSKR
uniref:Uncharacterized protein n=1 Tax=viral metagenome TaxID=1070528 RepID=A0A6C0AXP6_9ZZZZ|tara:strand:+ start:131 stop:496 length:366 start_codon:yes stop_codon:yes gene_type:complete